MKAPEFWASEGALPTLLSPLGAGWAMGARMRAALGKPWRAPAPVVCVGNLVVGGAGKTPVTIDIAERLPGSHLLSRGYGGTERGPFRVAAGSEDAARVGDEALLLAATAPCWVARDRVAGARAASEAGATCVVLDDGFQDPALAKDLALIVVDGETGFGNGKCLPAGPLREPVRDGLARAGAVVILGEDRTGIAERIGRLPLLRARLKPDREIAASLAGKRILAFAGIGRPRKFFDTLLELGADLVQRREFPDHHAFTEAELAGLREQASEQSLLLVTTTKDAARLLAAARSGIIVLPVTVAWEDEAALDRLLAPIRARLP